MTVCPDPPPRRSYWTTCARAPVLNRRDVVVSHKLDMEYVCCMYGLYATTSRQSPCPPERALENIVFQSHYCIMSEGKPGCAEPVQQQRRMLCVCTHLPVSCTPSVGNWMAAWRHCVWNAIETKTNFRLVFAENWISVPWTNCLCIARLHRQESMSGTQIQTWQRLNAQCACMYRRPRPRRRRLCLLEWCWFAPTHRYDSMCVRSHYASL